MAPSTGLQARWTTLEQMASSPNVAAKEVLDEIPLLLLGTHALVQICPEEPVPGPLPPL